ncbi:metalloproteinase inhibitor 2-like [Ostrea edulis]|uniref:metalloproteinase inhibitor 2-like n=1 Tax=Ostrea edulis TaxID=37623 RepID=UPI0024AE9961|nr:metalloproteinase inhibitor 2-like [Ostrea edulis]
MPSSTRLTVTNIFRVDKVFKGNIVPDTEIKVRSVEDGSGCQLSFAVNRTYLVTGKFHIHGNIDISSCDWTACWEYGVSRFQKINLKRKGYKCNVQICNEANECASNPKTCMWPSGHKGMCYSKHAKCYMSSRFGKAVWATLHSRMNRCLRKNF